MEDYSFTVPEETGRPKPKKHPGCIFAAASVPLLFILLIMKAMVPTDWHIFTKSRIETLEHTFNMDLSDADLKRYWVPSVAQDISERCRFTVDDYSTFMENCFFGEIIMAPEAANASYASYKCRPKANSTYTLYINFTKKDGRYEANLTSYTE